MQNERGYTLVELMIAIGISMLILSAIYMVVNFTQTNTSGIERKVAAQQDIKPALDVMAMEISMASYNPTFAGDASIWVKPPGAAGCGSLSATPTYRGIQEATDNSIAVEMDIQGPGGGPSDGALGDPNESIRFSYDTANQYITRQTQCGGGGQPFLGDVPGNTRAVRVINSTLTPALPVFRYFDATGAEIAVGSLPGAIPSIRRILITLAVETEDVDPNTQQRRRLIYSTSVITRNHAISIF
jgi:type II secretory pathway pseudopilin PulG